ncbi:acetyl-CoA carboxylase biotin carboxylase subunit [uncultured Peptoniphilus sp.]|uniref:acetyl-CoA carboxylase biotin carboxylase subunit n=1 Tax=uncultured Peptoniphilus sp. TaxID=254354 RepID=UPI0028052DD7|nr:acetyl-CoA carboxylase biotin carboxylase subunit [uncultured Peptoniphilus sp.]
MLKRILIANRGEIALRILRSARELGIETVAVFSEADRESLAVKFADRAVCIGRAPAQKSYLNIDKLITVARALNCDGVHPGYGFLSESYEFALALEGEGIKFIGPDPETIKNMGNKSYAIASVKKLKVPTVPGSDGNVKNVDEALKIAEKIGYPVLLKAVVGGGGKGIRKVSSREEMQNLFKIVKLEAGSSFKDDSIYLEKFIENPRHIEVQILADDFGNVIALPERNCSIQRENQKMIEESPAPNISNELEEKLKKAAINAAKACKYKNAGTVEFLVDRDENFYFIEMNTRIQVEHPVSEMVTGIDLIKEQLKIAAGLKLKIKNEDIKIHGHAIEARIIAKDPFNNFKASSGSLEFFHGPSGMDTRFDSDLYQGLNISPFYDSMIGKLIVMDKTRSLAIKKLRRALEELVITGVQTNLWYVYTICYIYEFLRGNYTTNFLFENEKEILKIMGEFHDKYLERQD